MSKPNLISAALQGVTPIFRLPPNRGLYYILTGC